MESDKRIRLGLLGLGTVGGGVVQLLRMNKDELRRRSGADFVITAVAVRNVDAPRSVDTDGLTITDDAASVVMRDDVDVVVELIGGIEPAKTLILAALANGKSVVSANKHLFAEHGEELAAAARRYGRHLLFEASCAGGIPIIRGIRSGISADRIDWLAGIINGTTNFILSKITDDHVSFDDALAEANRLGYLEADPSLDIDGIDAAHKLAILASCAFGVPFRFDGMFIEGIRRVTLEDVLYAREFGYVVKLIGHAHRHGDGICLRVHPTLLRAERLLANVHGVMNAVVVHGNAAGTLMFYGAGAGALPTASAVWSDIIAVARATRSNCDCLDMTTINGFVPDAAVPLPLVAIDDVVMPHYLRLNVRDETGVLNHITRVTAEHGVSIEAVTQKEPTTRGSATIAMITDAASGGKLQVIIDALTALDCVTSVHHLRVDDH